MLTIIRATGLVTVQDLGWVGHRSIGLPPGGAMDPDGLRIGNALVGNPDGAAGLELAQGQLVLGFDAASAVAVVGGAVVRLNGAEVPSSTQLAIPKGGRLEIASEAGRRFVLMAIQGGVDVPLLLGSRSTYLPTALGGSRAAGSPRATNSGGDPVRPCHPGPAPRYRHRRQTPDRSEWPLAPKRTSSRPTRTSDSPNRPTGWRSIQTGWELDSKARPWRSR